MIDDIEWLDISNETSSASLKDEAAGGGAQEESEDKDFKKSKREEKEDRGDKDRDEMDFQDDRGLWGCVLTICGVNYSVPSLFSSKKAARSQLAEDVLIKLYPDAYKKMLLSQIETMKATNRLRNEVTEKNSVRLALFADQMCTWKPVVYNSTAEDTQETADKFADSNRKNSDNINSCSSDAVGASLTSATGSADQTLEMVAEKIANNLLVHEQIERDELLKAQLDQLAKDRFDYVTDADVEEYLRGLLWTLQMYCEGICPDVTYNYFGRPSPSVMRVVEYLERYMPLTVPRSIADEYSVDDKVQQAEEEEREDNSQRVHLGSSSKDSSLNEERGKIWQNMAVLRDTKWLDFKVSNYKSLKFCFCAVSLCA